jgi:ATP-dependent helicase/nuclease subunit A
LTRWPRASTTSALRVLPRSSRRERPGDAQAHARRLGPEAAESLDEFLDLALAFDRESPPSLQGFVNALRSTDVEIKRDMEQKRDEVRIMTVHGAKGLQAPIVFLPDTMQAPRRQGVGIYA